MFIGALNDFMLKFLIVCASIEIAIETGFAEHEEMNTGTYHQLINFFLAWIEGFAIFVGVFIVASVGSWNDW